MSKKDNGWYLLEALLHTFTRLMRPRLPALGIGLAVALPLILIVTSQADSIARHPVVIQLIFVLVFGVVMAGAFIFGRRRTRTAYLKGLAAHEPEPLIAAIERLFKPLMKVMLDAEAFLAQGKALAYAFYDREAEASRTLAAIAWRDKAPLVRAAGLHAEGIVTLLCRRDVARALELTRRSRALASVNSAIPGAAQSERAYAAMVAVCESLAGELSPEGRTRLAASAVDVRFPPAQLLSALALAVDAERTGDGAGAARWRQFLRDTAPHCPPLHLPADAFATPVGERPPAEEGPVSSNLASTSTSTSGAPASPRRKVLNVSLRLLAFWAVALGMFLAIWTFLSR